MIRLSATTQSIELVTSSSTSVDWQVSYIKRRPGVQDEQASDAGNVASATDTTIVAAPAEGSITHLVDSITVRNKGTAALDVTVMKDVSGTEYHLTPVTALQPGEVLAYESGTGWHVLDVSGRRKTTSEIASGTSGKTVPFYKIGITGEAAGQWYTWALNTGFPGAWSPGTDGVNGRATDGTGADDVGCLPWTNASTGAWYLTGFSGSSSVANRMALYDVLWVNDALDVTDTMAQAITSPTLPARDLNGATAGAGVMVGILVTGATGNGGAVTDITLDYTNSAGTASRTATMASFPATATAGTVVWFELEAGDVGVRSIQGITIGTTLTSGTISLIAARKIAAFGNAVANVGGSAAIDRNTGIRLYSGSCLLLMGLLSATTATTIEGEITLANR